MVFFLGLHTAERCCSDLKIRKLFAVIISAVLLTSVVGCTKEQAIAIPEPTIPMKTVTQNSKDDYITFEYTLPEDWESGSLDYFSAGGTNKANIGLDIEKEKALPILITIKKYAPFMSEDEENINQMYRDLFAGKPKAYKNYLNYFHKKVNLNENQDSSNSYSLITTPSKWDGEQNSSEQNISNFSYICYQGGNGKIMEVRYSYQYMGKTYHAVNCILEKTPYVVLGGLDDTLELSSGDIALWVADSLKVIENYTIKDGSVVKNR